MRALRAAKAEAEAEAEVFWGEGVQVDPDCYRCGLGVPPTFAMPAKFDFRRLEAYRIAVALYGDSLPALRRLPWPERALADQMLRAASSITLNIAEGAGEFSGPEKIRFYRMARRSAWECAAILDLLKFGGVGRAEFIQTQHSRLEQISALLTTMILNRQQKPER